PLEGADQPPDVRFVAGLVTAKLMRVEEDTLGRLSRCRAHERRSVRRVRHLRHDGRMAGDPARVDRKVRSLAKTWNALGARDPLWAVLTDPSKRDRRWDPADFFANGEAEIAAVESELQALDLFPGRHLAVDFGCGVGRLRRALAARFESVIGLGVAAWMITEA